MSLVMLSYQHSLCISCSPHIVLIWTLNENCSHWDFVSHYVIIVSMPLLHI
jgi:hypothetical protein